MVIVKNLRDVKNYDVKEAYGQDSEGVYIKWISEKRTGGEEYLHNFALRYFTFKPGAYMAPHNHPWEQEIVLTKGQIEITGSGCGRVLNPGDAAYFPANEEHGFRTIGEEQSEFYCIIGCIGKGENCIGLSE